MNAKIICIALLAVRVSCAQIFTVREIRNSDSTYRFPNIQSSQRPDIAKKINAVIQLGIGGDPNTKNPFDKVPGEDEYFYELGGVNGRILCLITTGLHVGAGYHATRTHFNFDSRTGAAIYLNKLFGNDGKTKLKRALYKSWKELITAAVDDAIGGEDYKRCLEKAENLAELDVERMLIMDQGIKFWVAACLDGSSYEQDKVKGPYEFSFGQLLPMLTPYGYSLFVDKSAAAAPAQTLLRGTIDGKYPISLTLLSGSAEGSSGTVNGMIVYDRVGGVINLRGTMEGTRFSLHEVDESNNNISDISVAWDGTKLTGTFLNLKAKKQMSFSALPVQ